ncbi:hypothetical protein EKO27_g8671 [Xylaria grammica]|uniref:Uncharacterized protein n=1 Tax=Xylaria grammica TaxID=363999 RepID=A0A439CWC9_9PEZI|nr:hypothetical protein EKO27_g8671 [Xylaria grammica]
MEGRRNENAIQQKVVAQGFLGYILRHSFITKPPGSVKLRSSEPRPDEDLRDCASAVNLSLFAQAYSHFAFRRVQLLQGGPDSSHCHQENLSPPVQIGKTRVGIAPFSVPKTSGGPSSDPVDEKAYLGMPLFTIQASASRLFVRPSLLHYDGGN